MPTKILSAIECSAVEKRRNVWHVIDQHPYGKNDDSAIEGLVVEVDEAIDGQAPRSRIQIGHEIFADRT